jgi:hypothetical protein
VFNGENVRRFVMLQANFALAINNIGQKLRLAIAIKARSLHVSREILARICNTGLQIDNGMLRHSTGFYDYGRSSSN